MIFKKNITTKNKLPYKKIHKILLKNIRAEVSKINFEEKFDLLKSLRLRLEKLLLKNECCPLMIQQRVKSPQAITEKVVRKIERFFSKKSETSLYAFIKNIHLNNIQKNIFDVVGFRIIFADKKEVYNFFDILNSSAKFQVLQQESTDYIKQPKPNGYQALHVILNDKKSKTYFEVQILTFDMSINSGVGAAGWQNYQSQRKQSFVQNIWMVFLNFAKPKSLFFERDNLESSHIEE